MKCMQGTSCAVECKSYIERRMLYKICDEWLAQVIAPSHIDFPLYSLTRHLYSIGTH